MTCTLCFQRQGGPNSDETLLAACLLLLDASVFGEPSGLVVIMVTSEIVVAVSDIGRRVLRIHVAEKVGDLRAHNLCLGLHQQTHSSERARFGLLDRPLAMDVVDAEGVEDGAEGQDNTRGNGRYVTFDKDITGWNDCETQ